MYFKCYLVALWQTGTVNFSFQVGLRLYKINKQFILHISGCQHEIKFKTITNILWGILIWFPASLTKTALAKIYWHEWIWQIFVKCTCSINRYATTEIMKSISLNSVICVDQSLCLYYLNNKLSVKKVFVKLIGYRYFIYFIFSCQDWSQSSKIKEEIVLFSPLIAHHLGIYYLFELEDTLYLPGLSWVEPFQWFDVDALFPMVVICYACD